MTVSSNAGDQPANAIDSTVPHSARVWNYWLGGKDNYDVDREIGEQILKSTPQIGDCARASRAFLVRVVMHLAGPAGVHQFLDIGTGLPTADNTHEVAQRVTPAARIVYVDNDPLVLAHARALLHGTPEGVTAYIDGDIHDGEAVLVEAARTLDFDQPVAVILMNILGHIPDLHEARSIVRTLVDAVPAGSFLVVSDATAVIEPKQMEEAAATWNKSASPPYVLRPPDEFQLFFEGLEMLEPGVGSATLWRPNKCEIGRLVEVDQLGGVGRLKPS